MYDNIVQAQTQIGLDYNRDCGTDSGFAANNEINVLTSAVSLVENVHLEWIFILTQGRNRNTTINV